FGIEIITYRATDEQLAFDDATLTITVVPVNDMPVVTGETYNIDEDQACIHNLADNDSDVETGNLTYTSSGASHGVFLLNTDGSFNYTPFENWHGTETILYQATDEGDLSASATLVINVASVNDAPVAADDTQNIGEDIAESGDVSLNDNDVDDETLSFELISPPLHGTLEFETDGTFLYTPSLDYTGLDEAIYEVCDDDGACDQATITFNVGQSNDTPVANANTFNTTEDNAVSGSVALNDYDLDGDALTFSPVSAAQYGTLELLSNGDFSYVPFDNQSGTEVITYQVCDPFAACATATLTINVNPVNDPPVATGDIFVTTEDAVLNGDIASLASDIETATLSFSLVSESLEGTFNLASNGQFTYTPSPDYWGIASFVYAACDAQGMCTNATVEINVLYINDYPVANDDELALSEDQVESINLAANDSDVEDEVLTITIISDPVNGTYTLDNGVFTYYPFENYFGPDEITYQACDSDGACVTAVLTIEVIFINDLPQTFDDEAFGVMNEWLYGTVADNDIELDPETLTYQALSEAQNGQFILNFDGTFSYLPNDGFTGIETIMYLACDPCGACDAAVLVIYIDEENTAPVTTPAFATICAGSEITVALNPYISDAENSDNSLHITAASVASGTVTFSDATNSLTYTPADDFAGEVVITYTVCDNDVDQLCTDGQVTVTIEAPVLLEITSAQIQNVSCFGESDGSISLEISGGDGDYTYDWSNGSDQATILGLDADTYTVTIHSDATCTLDVTESFVITQPEAPLVINGLVADAINDTPGGSSAYDVTGGTPPYSYQWTDENGDVVGIEQQLVLNDAALQGSYTLRVTDDNGCEITQTIMVTDIGEFAELTGFSIFPVPANDFIQLGNIDGNFETQIFDMAGRKVYAGKNERRIDISMLACGSYLIRVSAAAGTGTAVLVKAD
ncbi:MAG: tandem-95 repeat protein, partial [Flavobacteriales bacterium]|nr:tandem-95 repeat protein [Flavobacteriales bacterium]